MAQYPGFRAGVAESKPADGIFEDHVFAHQGVPGRLELGPIRSWQVSTHYRAVAREVPTDAGEGLRA
jgi:hypothetical protein